MSCGFKKFKGFFGLEVPPTPERPAPVEEPPSKGTPSTTNKGLLELPIEFTPRILMSIALPGSPEPVVTLTPAILPCNNCPGALFTPLLNTQEFLIFL